MFCRGKSRCTAFLGIKAYGNPLNRPDIVHGTLLVKISQSDVPAGLINLDRCDGRGDFLYQGKLFLPVAVIGTVNQILKGRARRPLVFQVPILYHLLYFHKYCIMKP